MSTSNTNPSSPSPDSPGSCVVCGKETFERCSACSNHGLDWMFFCGQDHQKLIWPLHKRVCGPTSNPFRFPLLTQEEHDTILELSAKPCGERVAWKDEITDCMKMYKVPSSLLPPSKGQTWSILFEHNLEKYLESANGASLNDVQRRRGIVDIRSRTWFYRVKGAYPDRQPLFQEVLNFLIDHPFDSLAHLQSQGIFDYVAIENEVEPWWSAFQHKVIALLALVCVFWRKRDSTREERAKIVCYLQHSYEELVKYCKDVVKLSDPQGAKDLVSKFVNPLLLQHTDVTDFSLFVPLSVTD